jgi:hypothetical protein
MGRTHVATGSTVEYLSCPPASGRHYIGTNVGPIRTAVYGPNEEVGPQGWIHNLEHGGIVVLYKCATPCPDLVRQLEETFPALPKSKFGHAKVVVSPNPRVKGRLALLAWTRIDDLDRFDRDRIVRFVQAYQDKGPEDVP